MKVPDGYASAIGQGPDVEKHERHEQVYGNMRREDKMGKHHIQLSGTQYCIHQDITNAKETEGKMVIGYGMAFGYPGIYEQYQCQHETEEHAHR